MRALALLAAVSVLLSTGCGETRVSRGRAVFRSSCAGCHTVAGRERGAVGGDLVLAHLDVADLASFARVMPASKPLSRADALAVADFVHGRAVSLATRGASR
ncbi:MAG TPA: cytochrome c [Gaiellaceae bacterium]